MLRAFMSSIAVCLVLAACGGGGGDSSAAGSNAPPPAFTLNSSNYKAAAATTFDLLNLALAVASIPLEPLGDYIALGIAQTATGSCDLGGSLTLSVDDRDRNARMSSGDVFSVGFSACRVQDATIDGSVAASIQSLTLTAPSYRLVATISTTGYRIASPTGAFPQTSIAATLNVTADASPIADRQQFTASTISVTSGSTTDSVSGLSIDVDQRYDTFRYAMSASGSVSSTTAGGNFTFETTTPFTGSINQYPNAGRMVLRTGSNSTVVVAEEGAAATNPVAASAQIDANGDGNFELRDDALAWTEIADRLTFSPLRRDITGPISTAPPGGPGSPPPPPPPANATVLNGRSVALGAQAGDLEVDIARSVLYVSLPSRNEVAVVSTSTYQVLERIVVGSSPRGIHLSIDGRTLFVANNSGGSVSTIDLANRSTRTIELATQLGSALAFDVAEYAPGRLLVTANPGSSGLAHVVTVDVATGGVARAAGSQFIRADPIIVIDGERRFAYVGEGFSPESIYKIDLQAPNLPIVLEDQHGSVSGTNAMDLNSDSSRLVTSSGQLLRTGSLIEDARLPATGTPRFSVDGSTLWLAAAANSITSFDGRNFAAGTRYSTDCPNEPIRALRHVGGGRWVLLTDATLCAVDALAPTSPPGQGGGSTPPSPPTVSVIGTRVELGGIGADLAFDTAGRRLFASLPSRNEIAVVASSSMAITSRFTVSGRPQGIALSSDNATIYAALNDTGQLAYVNAASGAISATVDVRTLLDHPSTWDVIETAPGRIFVSANPQSGGFAYIVEVRRDQGNAARRVASDRIIRAAPVFSLLPDGSALFVAEGFSPESLYKLDLAQPSAPIVAEDEHGSFTGSQFIVASLDSTRVFSSSGMVLGSNSVRQVGLIGAGVPLPLPGSRDVLVASANGDLLRYDAATFVLKQRITSNCGITAPSRLVADTAGADVFILGNDLLCRISLPALD